MALNWRVFGLSILYFIPEIRRGAFKWLALTKLMIVGSAEPRSAGLKSVHSRVDGVTQLNHNKKYDRSERLLLHVAFRPL